MSRTDQLQAALTALNVEMVAKLKLEADDHWPDFCSDYDEPEARRQHKRLVDRLAETNSGIRPIAPS